LEGLPIGHQRKYYEVKDQTYLEEDEFSNEIERQEASFHPGIFEIPMKDISIEVGDKMAIPRDRLYSLTRDRMGTYGRAIIAYWAREMTGSLVKDIARHFHKEPMTIGESIIKIEGLMEEDKELAKKIEAMRSNLVKRGKKKYFITVACPQNTRNLTGKGFPFRFHYWVLGCLRVLGRCSGTRPTRGHGGKGENFKATSEFDSLHGFVP
jgi:hypothetical protein